jgi:hypothetical protein
MVMVIEAYDGFDSAEQAYVQPFVVFQVMDSIVFQALSDHASQPNEFSRHQMRKEPKISSPKELGSNL